MFKQLIESMITDYLTEDVDDYLVDDIFEEVSEETWEAIEEAILNELSPELLDRYKKKAFKQMKASDNARPNTIKARDKHLNRIRKRNKGIGSALKRDMVHDMDKGNPVYVPRSFRSGEYKDRSMTGKTPEQMKQQKDVRNLSADDFQKKYKMSKTDWQKKHHRK